MNDLSNKERRLYKWSNVVSSLKSSTKSGKDTFAKSDHLPFITRRVLLEFQGSRIPFCNIVQNLIFKIEGVYSYSNPTFAKEGNIFSKFSNR